MFLTLIKRSLQTQLILFTAVAMVGCSSQLKYQSRGDSEAVQSQVSSGVNCKSPYIVKSGDTLSGIAYDCKVDMLDIAKINDLLPPYIIYINQELVLPAPTSPVEQASARSVKRVVDSSNSENQVSKSKVKTSAPITKVDSVKESRQVTVQQKRVDTKSNTAKAIERSENSSQSKVKPGNWVWPMHKGLEYRFRRDNAGLSVLEIYGIPGQKIRAVAPGKVVYSGNGIANYGWMIVIKHDNDYMSIYAHNSVLLAQEGDDIEAGEEIALLGGTGATDRPKLYLEARYQGRKIDIKKKLNR